jgi:hypothetical protein
VKQQGIGLGLVLLSTVFLTACDSSDEKTSKTEAKAPVSIFNTENKADVLPYLNIKEQPAKIALPFCETKNCINLDIQTIDTVDPWMNTWINKQQASVIQDQIGLKQNMTLQQAVSAYVKKSDAWQAETKSNDAFELAMYTRIPYQRNQYVLLQIGVDTQQEAVKVKERYYFFVADRRAQKMLKMLDVIAKDQQHHMDAMVQKAYQQWLIAQALEVQKAAPKKLYWGQADWFFDQEGLGLHYRTHEIVEDGQQLDIYLTKQQTQQVVKPDFYTFMF